MDRLSASACPVIVSGLDHRMVDHHDAENASLLYCFMYHAGQDQSAVTVHPFGVEKTPHERIHELKGWYGDQIGSSTWPVNFDKWEQRGQTSSSTWLFNLYVLLYLFNLCVFSI